MVTGSTAGGAVGQGNIRQRHAHGGGVSNGGRFMLMNTGRVVRQAEGPGMAGDRLLLGVEAGVEREFVRHRGRHVAEC